LGLGILINGNSPIICINVTQDIYLFPIALQENTDMTYFAAYGSAGIVLAVDIGVYFILLGISMWQYIDSQTKFCLKTSKKQPGLSRYLDTSSGVLLFLNLFLIDRIIFLLLLVTDQLSTASPFATFLFMELASLFFMSSALLLIYQFTPIIQAAKNLVSDYQSSLYDYFMASFVLFMYLLFLGCLIAFSIVPSPTLDVTCATTAMDLSSLQFGSSSVIFIVYSAFYALLALGLCFIQVWQGITICYYVLKTGEVNTSAKSKAVRKAKSFRLAYITFTTSFFLVVHTFYLITRLTDWQWSSLAFFLFILVLDVISVGVFISMHIFAKTQISEDETRYTTASTKMTSTSRASTVASTDIAINNPSLVEPLVLSQEVSDSDDEGKK